MKYSEYKDNVLNYRHNKNSSCKS